MSQFHIHKVNSKHVQFVKTPGAPHKRERVSISAYQILRPTRVYLRISELSPLTLGSTGSTTQPASLDSTGVYPTVIISQGNFRVWSHIHHMKEEYKSLHNVLLKAHRSLLKVVLTTKTIKLGSKMETFVCPAPSTSVWRSPLLRA